MSIDVGCQNCGKGYRLPDAAAGKRVRCSACNAAIAVPAAAEPAAADDERASPVGVAAETAADYAGPFARFLGGNGRTAASNPGRAPVDPVQLWKSYPSAAVAAAVLVVVGLVGSARSGEAWPVLVFGGVGLLLPLLDWLGHVRQFEAGDVNPAVVVGDAPWTVAVLADLGRRPGVGKRPAVAVVRQPLGRMAGDRPRVGMRLATVSFYAGTLEPDVWGRIDPTVANLVVTRPAAIRRLLASIPDRQWRALDAAVANLPSYDPGTYRLWPGGRNSIVPVTRQGFRYAGYGLLVVMALITVAALLDGPDPRRSTAPAVSPPPAPAVVIAPPAAPGESAGDTADPPPVAPPVAAPPARSMADLFAEQKRLMDEQAARTQERMAANAERIQRETDERRQADAARAAERRAELDRRAAERRAAHGQ